MARSGENDDPLFDSDDEAEEVARSSGATRPGGVSDSERAIMLEGVRAFLTDGSAHSDPDRIAAAIRTMLKLWGLDPDESSATRPGDYDDRSIVERIEAAVGRESDVTTLSDRVATHASIAQLLVSIGEKVEATSASDMASVLQYAIVLSDMVLKTRRVYATLQSWVGTGGSGVPLSETTAGGDFALLDEQAKSLGFLPPPLLQPRQEGEPATKALSQFDLRSIVHADAWAKGYKLSEDGVNVLRPITVELEALPGEQRPRVFETPAWCVHMSLKSYVIHVLDAASSPENVRRALNANAGVLESLSRLLVNASELSPYLPRLNLRRELFAYNNAAVDISSNHQDALARSRKAAGPLTPPSRANLHSSKLVFRKFATAEKGSTVAGWLKDPARACSVAIFVASSDPEEARRDWERLRRKNEADRFQAIGAGAQLHGAAASTPDMAAVLAGWADDARVRWSSPSDGSAIFVEGPGRRASVARFRGDMEEEEEDFVTSDEPGEKNGDGGHGFLPSTRVDPELDAFLVDATARAAGVGAHWRPCVMVYGVDAISRDVAACNFFDVRLDVEGLRTFLDGEEGADWTDIRTPNVERVMTSQGWAPDVRRWAYVMLGRMLYAQNKFDKWQVATFMAGMPGTGKGTLVTLMADMFPPSKRGLISAVSEQTFGLESLLDKYILYGPEIGDGGSIPEQLFFSIVAGESVKINQKNKIAVVEHDGMGHVIVAVNKYPPVQWMKTARAFARRAATFPFPNMIRVDTNLPRAMRVDDMASGLMIKLACAYMWGVHLVGKQAVALHLPESIRNVTDTAIKVRDVLERFVSSGRVQLWISTEGYREWLKGREAPEAPEDPSEVASLGKRPRTGTKTKTKKKTRKKEKTASPLESFEGPPPGYDPPPEFVTTKMELQEAYSRFCRKVGSDSGEMDGMFADMNLASRFGVVAFNNGGIDYYKGVRVVPDG